MLSLLNILFRSDSLWFLRLLAIDSSRLHLLLINRTVLGLQQELKDRKKSYRFALMTKILSEDEKHAVLFSAYSVVVNGRNQMLMTTCAAARGEPQPTSVYAKSHTYYNSFLPKTIRDLRIGPQH